MVRSRTDYVGPPEPEASGPPKGYEGGNLQPDAVVLALWAQSAQQVGRDSSAIVGLPPLGANALR